MPNKPNAPETIELTEDELRAIAGYAADCASPVLTLFERDLPSDTRPRDAVDAARVFAAGGPRTDALRQSAWAAFKAAREPSLSPAAADAARAASPAAAAYLHPRASAHQVKHVLGAAAHAARAEELASAAGTDGTAVGAGALARARDHAPAAVRTVLGRLPVAPPGGGPVGALVRALDAALRT